MRILDNGIKVEHGEFQYLWFRVVDDQGHPRHRAIALRELTALALDTQEIEDYNAWGKQWGVVRGLYNAEVDFVFAAAGMFHPEHIGVVQFYGAAAEGSSIEHAAGLAMSRLASVEAVLANFQQSQTRPPLLRWMEWYLDFVTRRANQVSAILGHPDPRDARKGLALMDGRPVDENRDLSAEQNEMLFRGLAKLREDFVFQITADRLAQRDLTRSVARVAREVSKVASRQRGAISIGASVSIPILASLSNAVGGGQSRSESEAHSETKGQQHSWGEGETDGQAHTESFSHTEGEAETHGVAVTRTEGKARTKSQSDTESHAITHGEAHTKSHAVTKGEAHTRSSGVTHSHAETHSQGSFQSQGGGHSVTESSGQSETEGDSLNVTEGESQSKGWNASAGAQGSVGIPGTLGGGVNANAGLSGQEGESSSATQGVNHSETESAGHAESHSSQWSSGQSQGHAVTKGVARSSGQAHTKSRSETWGEAHTKSRSETWGKAHTEGRAETESESVAVTESHSKTKSVSNTWGVADTVSHAESRQEGWGESHQQGITLGKILGRNSTRMLSRGLSTGLSPGISLNRSWQTEDDLAILLTNVLRQVEGQLNMAAAEGGFLGEAVLLTASERGAKASQSLVPQAFHGPHSPTPVLTVTPEGGESDLLRHHALAFLPTRKAAPNDLLGGALGGLFSTVLTPQQLAAYTAPAIFREGTARVIPAIPKDGLGFYPDMPGDVLLGHQFSPETGDLTNAPVMLEKGRYVHMMFAGATGYGKSVGAIRLIYEIVHKWEARSIVLDFGAGWRQLLNGPGIEDQVDIRQLTPYGVRPLRWNPLQISRHIIPEIQMASFVDIFGNVAQLGVKQQKHRFFDAVEHLYLREGVLVNDPKVLADPHWGQVADQAEATASGLPVGTSLQGLTIEQRQAIAVERSKSVSLQDLYDIIQERHDALSPRNQVGRGILQGIMERLKTLLRGATAAQFDAGADALDVAELGQGEKPLLILEGGKHLDQFSKAWLLSWAGWILYEDMVQRKEKQLVDDDDELVMVFEEANIIFTGLGAQDEFNKGAPTVAEQYDNMFRDSRKYKVNFIVITQSPSLIPPGVRSSCSSVFLGFLSEPDDKDVALAALAKSEKGFRDEAWRRFVSDAGIGMSLGRLPYSFHRTEMRPFLFRPLMLRVDTPKDGEIAKRLGRIQL
jgi:hypothetical protein